MSNKVRVQFKDQQFQTDAVEAVVGCFAGQPKQTGALYTVDPGVRVKDKFAITDELFDDYDDDTLDLGYANNELCAELNSNLLNSNLLNSNLLNSNLLANIRKVQMGQSLTPSASLIDFQHLAGKEWKPLSGTDVKARTSIANVNIDVEMETGTGKTYVYIKTILELNKHYGWTKFVIVVPSVAIREGVKKSLEMTETHFRKAYGTFPQSFIYDSNRLEEVQDFATSDSIHIMIINTQAFASKEGRLIDEERDEFQSRKPIDVIKANRPILIIDEPQRVSGKATVEALAKFEPLFVLRYSATHNVQHNLVHRLDAIDAFNRKLVKKITLVGFTENDLSGTSGYIHLNRITLSKNGGDPQASITLEVKQKNGDIKRKAKTLGVGASLYDASGSLEAYRDIVIDDIIPDDSRTETTGTVKFSNGDEITSHQADNQYMMNFRRLQIREAINAHLNKEQELFDKGIKVLSLFFIDHVNNYRVYGSDAEEAKSSLGVYAEMFEEEYAQAVADTIAGKENGIGISKEYQAYLKNIDVRQTHNGYFSMDKKGSAVDTTEETETGNAGKAQEEQQSAYDLIMKDKERLLSLDEPTRFIFSHSALREGWDNPNIFVICLLKHITSDAEKNITPRRQEVGRGLRLAVDKHGVRQDDPSSVHEINTLAVIVNETHDDFVTALQGEITDSISRPKAASKEYFEGKTVATEKGERVTITKPMANEMHRYLIKNSYIDSNDNVTEKYHDDVANNTVAEMPETLAPHREPLLMLVNNLFSGIPKGMIENLRKTVKINPNDNLGKKEFIQLWNHINLKGYYTAKFDSSELIRKAIKEINKSLHIAKSSITKETSSQDSAMAVNADGEVTAGFDNRSTERIHIAPSNRPEVKYDLVGDVAQRTELTRKTVVAILKGMSAEKFALFAVNPEKFITDVSRLINEQVGTMLIGGLQYHILDERYDFSIFNDKNVSQSQRANSKLTKHVYDYVATDSQVEVDFALALEAGKEVNVFAKLPSGFKIPTPVGDYNPDWAVAFNDGSVKHVYFVAETKGSLSDMDIRSNERSKIACARKFFDALNAKIKDENVRYDVVVTYDQLLDLATRA